jgi:hypothetical protein
VGEISKRFTRLIFDNTCLHYFSTDNCGGVSKRFAEILMYIIPSLHTLWKVIADMI